MTPSRTGNVSTILSAVEAGNHKKSWQLKTRLKRNGRMPKVRVQTAGYSFYGRIYALCRVGRDTATYNDDRTD